MNKDYEPFGELWEKEMNRFNKKDLIQLYKKSCEENIKREEYAKEVAMDFANWIRYAQVKQSAQQEWYYKGKCYYSTEAIFEEYFETKNKKL